MKEREGSKKEAPEDFAEYEIFLVAMRLGETPVPISNTMVKT